MEYSETGVTLARDIITSTTKCFDNNFHKLKTVAPSTLRTPPSFVRCSATK